MESIRGTRKLGFSNHPMLEHFQVSQSAHMITTKSGNLER